MEAGKGHQVPWSWSYRLLVAAMWELGTEPGLCKSTNCLWPLKANRKCFLPGTLHYSVCFKSYFLQVNFNIFQSFKRHMLSFLY